MALKVLIVDDSSAMRAVIKKTLRAAGFNLEQCLEAPDGQQALETDRKSTRLNSSHNPASRMPSSA
jgi:two-component system chemotaxis response regulator CheY